MNCKRIFRT